MKIIYYNIKKGDKMSKINIKNLNYKRKNSVIFKKFNLKIDDNSYNAIIGPVGSGKTILFKLIINNCEGIKVDGNVNYVVTDPNMQIVSKTVKEQLSFFLERDGYTKRQITMRLKNIIKTFELDKILDKDPFLLSEGEKQLVVLSSILVLDLDILLLDNALCRLDKYTKNKVLKYLLKLKKKKVTIINFTSDIEEIMDVDNVILINKKLIFNKKLKEALKEEKLFNENDLNLPFVSDVSLKLHYYGLLNGQFMDIKEMVDELWK